MSKQVLIIEGESIFSKALRLLLKLHAAKKEAIAREVEAEITEPTWRTKDGKVLRPCDFTDVHLLNTVRYIERRMDRLRDVLVDPMAGAGLFDPESDAAYHADLSPEDTYFDSALQAELEKLAPIHTALVGEAERRGLAGALQTLRRNVRR